MNRWLGFLMILLMSFSQTTIFAQASAPKKKQIVKSTIHNVAKSDSNKKAIAKQKVAAPIVKPKKTIVASTQTKATNTNPQRSKIAPKSQVKDTTPVIKDTAVVKKTSSFLKALQPAMFHLDKPPFYAVEQPHIQRIDKDFFFYSIIAILLLYGMIRTIYPKYFSHLFYYLWNPQQKNKLEREHIAQNNLPSLLLNAMFCLSGGFCIALLTIYKTQDFEDLIFMKWWGIYALSIAIIYLVKYLIINFFGFIFNNKNTSALYGFIVFQVNKITGILILPLIIVRVFFNEQSFTNDLLTLTGLALGVLLLYRYIAYFRLAINNMKTSAFQFFIYLCAVEIMPLLIVIKLLSHSLPQYL